MKQLDWLQFDRCVDLLVKRFRDRPFSGIHGVPRGGLCLGVALSHALELPLQLQPDDASLIVDDVYESGRTLQALRSRWPHATYAVWISKVTPEWTSLVPRVSLRLFIAMAEVVIAGIHPAAGCIGF